MYLENLEKVCVAGWGRTGISLAKLLLFLGKKVSVTEEKKENNFSLSLIKDFQAKGVEFEFGAHSQSFLSGSQLVLLSPGINFFDSRLGEIIRQNHLPYMGELEFAYRLNKAKIIAITGTNGKTTTAYLTYLLLKKKGAKVYLGGNIGRPFSDMVINLSREDFVVLEVSSFQLETIIRFKPYIGALLNVYPDHLSRHKNFNNYFQTKMKIFQNQQNCDWALLNGNNRLSCSLSSRLNSRVVYFGKEFSNENFACAAKIGEILGLSKTDCFSVFSGYKNLPHRQQYLGMVNKIKFINDSKATNLHSTLSALQAVESRVVLIAGGKDKGISYSPLRSYSRKIKKINLIGEAGSKIKEDLKEKIQCQQFNSLESAVLAAAKEAGPGGTVLFSPMCASFDMFADYQQRGREFIRIVKKIPKEANF